MSLSTLLESRMVKDWFAEHTLKPVVGDTPPKIIPRTNHYGLVGTAFDYMVRFYLGKLYPRARRRRWVAEKGMDKLLEWDSEEWEALSDEDRSTEIALRALDRAERVTDTMKEAKLTEKAYRNGSRTPLKKLAETCLRLAQLDVIFRSGYVDLRAVDPEDASDLVALFKLFLKKRAWYKARSTVVLNPTFGFGSVLIGGADADLVLDDEIVDIKCVKQRRLHRNYFNQLVGYYLLSRIGGINSAPKRLTIKRVGVYFARHGDYYSFPLTDLVNMGEIDRLTSSFEKLIKRNRVAIR